MLPYEKDVIGVIDNAYRAGFTIPHYIFDKDQKLIEDSPEEFYYVPPLFIAKPKGVEFSYILFWTGEKFRGGYIAITNNYSGVQRGYRERNGGTIFAAHIKELRLCIRKLMGEEPCWVAYSFVLGENGRLYFWGTDSIDFYADPIEHLTGESMKGLTDMFMNPEKNKRPEGFVSFLPVFCRDKPTFLCTGDPKETVSKSWRILYEKLECLSHDFWFSVGIDSYARNAYAQLQTKKVLG